MYKYIISIADFDLKNNVSTSDNRVYINIGFAKVEILEYKTRLFRSNLLKNKIELEIFIENGAFYRADTGARLDPRIASLYFLNDKYPKLALSQLYVIAAKNVSDHIASLEREKEKSKRLDLINDVKKLFQKSDT